MFSYKIPHERNYRILNPIAVRNGCLNVSEMRYRHYAWNSQDIMTGPCYNAIREAFQHV
jgi:hypothetical protein